MKMGNMVFPTWKHLKDRDDRLRILAKQVIAYAAKSRESVCTPEDMDKVERTAQKALKFIGA